MPSSPKVPVQSVPVLEPGGSGRMSFEWYRAFNDLARAVRELQAGGGGGGGITTEDAVDAVAAALAAGAHSNITVTYNDAGNSLSLSASAGYTDEQAVDAVATAIANGTHTGISIAYNDAANSLSFTNTDPGGGSTVPEAVSLYAAMVSWWDWEQNDGTASFTDSVGTNHMVPRTAGGTSTTATLSTASGRVARAFNPNNTGGNTAYIPVASGFKLPNTPWTIGLWAQIVTSASASARFIMGNVGSSASDMQVYIHVDGTSSTIQFGATTTGSVASQVKADSGIVAPSTSEWMFIAATLDRAANQITIRVRGATAGSVTKVSTSFPSALFTGATTANFCINEGLTNNTTYFSGTRTGVFAADSAFYCGSAITDAEFDYLYNAGSGRSWANIVTDSGN